MTSQWFYQLMGKEVGPISGEQLRDLVRRGVVSTDTLVRLDDGDWVRAETEIPGMLVAAPISPRPTPPPPTPVATEVSVEANRSTKACPDCGEEILAVAIKCKHCGSNLDAKPAEPPHGSATGTSEAPWRPLLGLLAVGGAIVCVAVLVWLCGCAKSRYHVGATELIEDLNRGGLEAKKGEQILTFAQNSELAFWITFRDYGKISAYRFASEAVAKEKAEMLDGGLNVGCWAFGYVDSPDQRSKIIKALPL
jgi:predicted RNA-binding Zn-ribbon protein involved in translation (DUF1610 family)